MTYRLLITGSRDWAFPHIVEAQILLAIAEAQSLGKIVTADDVIIVHGDCPTGADAQANEIAERYGWNVESHPADWSIGKKAGPLRNAKMVDLGADMCLAFIGPSSKGAKGCAKMAENAGIKTKRIIMEY